MLKKFFVFITTLPLIATILNLIRSYILGGCLSYEASEVFEISFALSFAIFLFGRFFNNQRFNEWFDQNLGYDEDDVMDEDDIIGKDNTSSSIVSIISVVIVLSIVVIAVVFSGKTTSYYQKNDYKNSEIDKVEVETISETPEKINIEYTDEGCFLHSLDGDVVGPFQYIVKKDFEFYLDSIGRYIKNGLYGYINRNGEIITDPVFLYAGKFQDGIGKVQTYKETVFYIDEKGAQFTKEYSDGAENFEMQGQYCRIKTADGKWGIINREDKIICAGFDSINKLPLVTTYASGIRNGHAVLFEIGGIDSDKEFRLIKEYADYPKISAVHVGEFAFVWDAQDNVGVIDSNGEIIVETKYTTIEYLFTENNNSVGSDFTLANIIFLAKNSDGKTSIIYGYKILSEK